MSEFSESVYKVVSKIPKGKTMTYKQVAEVAGRPKAWRAVGNILDKNPNTWFAKRTSAQFRVPRNSGPGTRDGKVPCHRVIRSDGEIGGYAFGKSKKRAILKSEGAV